MIEERIQPDAFLLVECHDPNGPGFRESYDRSESIIGAICLITLLAPEQLPHKPFTILQHVTEPSIALAQRMKRSRRLVQRLLRILRLL